MSRTMAGMLVGFPGTAEASVAQVGGKGASLVRLARLGHPVPPGLVLTAAFFAPWLMRSLATDEWRTIATGETSQREAATAALKHTSEDWPLDDLQQQALASMREQLASLGSTLFAVRSSSPQEDMQGASFAGGYETCLGVAQDDLLAAIRRCFASIFDARVIAYKQARRLPLEPGGMAVVIQQQLDSDIAGVAFSLNPLDNDYDCAAIDASWGLGETVVAGLVTPDHWIIDKITGAVVESAIHHKPTSRRIDPGGGLVERIEPQASAPCLTAAQLMQLVALLRRVEDDVGHPVDMEWAYAEGTLHVLQARPVTAFVPLPAALRTEPGQRRRLYMDIALSSGLTINAPISRMGLDVFRRLFAGMAELALGSFTRSPSSDSDLVLMAGGRMYLDVSNVMWVSSPRRMARSMALNDTLMAQIMGTVDAGRYRSSARPSWARGRMLLRLPRALWQLRRAVGNAVLPFFAPQWTQRRIARKLDEFEAWCRVTTDDALPLGVWWQRYVAAGLRTLFEVSLPTVGPGTMAVQAFRRVAAGATDVDTELLDRLDRGFEGNVVVAMSIEMHGLSQCLAPGQRVDPDRIAERLAAGDLPAAFLDRWQTFDTRFGCRGPSEMDIAQPRYGDAPVVALRQLVAMPVDDPTFDPVASARRQIDARRATSAALMARVGPIRRRILQHLERIIEGFSGWRDTPKHHLLMLLHRLRRRLLLEGETLHRAGRLDDPQHVFALEFSELDAAHADPTIDLRALCASRLQETTRLASLVTNFPALIDSRGRILRPPPSQCLPGEFQGQGLSRGVVRGPARTLRSAHDTSLQKGDVLIAYTTDPGWTPLFVNAAAVVLEIGGALQHGAVVARELGLPCVASIAGISTAIADGTFVEVDGASGMVRILSPPHP